MEKAKRDKSDKVNMQASEKIMYNGYMKYVLFNEFVNCLLFKKSNNGVCSTTNPRSSWVAMEALERNQSSQDLFQVLSLVNFH